MIFSRNKLSEVFLLSPHIPTTSLQHLPLPSSWPEPGRAGLSPAGCPLIWYLLQNLVLLPTHFPLHPCKMSPKTESRLEFIWTRLFAAKKHQRKEQRAAGEDNVPWKWSLGLKMLSIIAVRHPSAALQTGVQITGSVWITTCSHTMTSRSHRLIWPAKSICRAAPNSPKPQKAPRRSAGLPACPRLGGGQQRFLRLQRNKTQP